MKFFLQLLLAVMILTATAQAQLLRPFASRYYNPSVRGNIVYVSNSIVSTAGIGGGSPGTGEVPPAGTTRNNTGAGINIDVDNPAPAVKLPFGSVWNYHASNAAPPNDGSARTWINPAYTLTGPWNVGASPVAGAGKYGYSSGQATCLPSGQTPICTPASGNKYTAYYFRRNVSFTTLELSTTFYAIQLNLLRNDGIVVYINGVERIRNNMPTGAVAYGTLASANITPGAAEAVSVNLSPSFFVAGANTIAVEVHLRANNSVDMSFDMQVLGLDNNGTFNSSTSDLNLPSCSQVLFAGLYWGADQGTSGTDSTWMTAGFNTIKLKIPGAASYQTLTSTQTNRHSLAWSTAGFNHTGYMCFIDITSLINASNPNGTYTAADVVAPIGIVNAAGGWTIVIAYANATLQPRNLTVFDGAVIVNLGDPPVDVNISGFLTPPSGPVSCELGAVVYDGDRSGQDSFSFRQIGAPTFYNMANVTVPLNGAADAWNSKISYKGTVVAARNPAFQNTLGYDASIFDLPNTGNTQLSNSQTGATVRFSSPNENYFVHVLSTSISQYNPTFAFDKTATDLNGGSFLPGDSLRYTINYTNQGNDSSINTVITDNLPSGTAYMPGSIRIGGVSKTDAAGDDQAEYDFTNNRIVFRIGVGSNGVSGGRVGPGVNSTVDFKVVTTSSCAIIGCIGSIRNSARINYGGKLSGAVLYDSSGVNTAGCIVQGPIINPLVGPCSTPADTLLANCTPSPILLPYARYAGYTFYSAMPFIPANIYNQYTPIAASGTYWAYYSNGFGCSDTVMIQLTIASPSTGPSSISASSTTICNPTSVPLTAVGGTLGTSANYQWGTGAVVGTSPIAGATSSTLTVSPAVTTTYWVRIENTISPCAATTGGTTVTITVRQPSIAPTSVSGPDICNPGSTTLTVVGGTLGTSANYQWGTGAVVGTSPIGGATSPTLTVSPTSTTTYWVRIENTAGPCTATTSGITKTVTVSQPSTGPTSITAPSTIYCNPGSATLTAVGGVLGTSANYQWGTGAVIGTSPIGGATSSTLTVSPTVTTTYWVRIENTSSPCTAATGGVTVTVTVRQPSVAPTSISGADICNPGSTTLTAVGGTLGTSANYQWGTGGVVGTSPIGGATSSTLTVSPAVTTTYWVRIENTSSPCLATTGGTTVTITVRQPSIAPTSISGADICNPGSVVLTAVGGTLGTSANYQWGTGAVVGTSPIGGATSSTLTVSPTSTTTYWVRIENTAGPCSATTSGLTRTVTVSQPSAAPTSVTGADFCNPGSTTLTALGATLGTSANYQWGTGAVVGISPIVGATSSTLTVSPVVTTTYWVRIENTAGPCTSNTSGLTKLITVSQPSVAATSAGKNKNNICPGISAKIFRTGGTLGTGATWKWYTGSPGGTLIGSGDTLTVTPLVTTTYYVWAEGFCNTTAQQSVTIFISCDIDKDRDGIPDWVESNIAASFNFTGGIINAYAPTYPGFVDNNNDYINDNFQADGDSDNDGIPNYLDLDFPGRIDSNGDGVDDRFDTDLDGIINMYDLDSDNDGIPDVVEAYGVDTDGDGKLDNFIDIDGDGLSDQVDANLSNAYNSGLGLGRPDFDGDGIPSYLDLDSDNDGIPDIIEVEAPDTNNDGKVDGFVDNNGDGLHDGYINATALLKTGPDVSPIDGRADSWPNKNKDRDLRPNAYDLDSDGDGITDVVEAGFPYFNGLVTGTIGANGWATVISSRPSLGLRFTDSDPYPDYLDIDSDNDGIPDNIEGQSTNGYLTPGTVDIDGDGLADTYETPCPCPLGTRTIYGGPGIIPYDHDLDGIPDYRDLDSDADGQPDIVEGNDFNLNGLADDLVTLTGFDTDGDGLDNRFDSLNSVTNLKGTSYRMGNGGSFTGDPTPGSRTTVQKKVPSQPDRDWRFVGVILPVDFLSFIGTLKNNNVLLNWTIIANKEVDHFEIERSVNNNTFNKVNTVTEPVTLNVQQSFSATDNITGINTDVIYYRLKVIGKAGEIKYSNVIAVKLNKVKHDITISPNPAKNKVTVTFTANKNQDVVIRLINNLGETMLFKNVKAVSGSNTIQLPEIINYGAGIYSVQVLVNEEINTVRLMIVR